MLENFQIIFFNLSYCLDDFQTKLNHKPYFKKKNIYKIIFDRIF